MQWLAAISVRRPVLASVVVLVFLVVGLLGYSRLEVDRFPKIDFPTVSVVTRLPGATPREIETEVTDKIEEAVNTVAGIEEVHSTSSEGVSQVLVTFLLEKNVDVAAQEVRYRVNQILADLPDDADPPIIEKLDPDAAPVLNLALVADRPVREITEYADKVLRRRLESVPGVGQVRVIGGRKRQVNVRLDPVRLHGHGLTAVDVQRAIRAQNVQIPAGMVKGVGFESGLRVAGKAASMDELARLVVQQRDGALVRLSDVAEVEDGEQEPATVARRNGVPSVVLSIRKQSGANTIGVVDAVVGDVARVATSPDGRIDVVASLDVLAAQGITSILFEGGAELAGSLLAARIPDSLLAAVFGVVAAVVALKMFLPLDHLRVAAAVPRGLGGNAIAATIGGLSAMMGIGGGTLSVPAMTLTGGAIHHAVGTAAFFGLLIALPGTLGYLLATPDAAMPPLTIGLVSLVALAIVAPCTMLTAPYGARLAHSLPRRRLSQAFGVFLAIVAARMLYRAWSS